MIAIVDYGVGNLFSLQSSLAFLGMEAAVTSAASEIRGADRVILPGVGAFGDAMRRLQQCGLAQVLREVAAAGTPLLGICLGMQLLFEESGEFGENEGLALIPGKIVSLAEALHKGGCEYKVPHMGWNALRPTQVPCPLLQYSREGDAVYYVHSFYAKPNQYTCATSEYGVEVSGVVQNRQVYGTQFHPEKSGAAGLAILRAFGEVGK